MPTPRQMTAVAQFRRFLEKHEAQERADRPDLQRHIVKFEVTETDYGCLWISAEIDMPQLSENNVLRALERQWWHVQVGRRGALGAWSYPQQYKQFKTLQKPVFGITFK